MLELIQDGQRIELDSTIEDVLKAIEYLKHQRHLQRSKYRRLFVPTGNPEGRPRKPKEEEVKPKRPRGRPRKNPPADPPADG